MRVLHRVLRRYATRPLSARRAMRVIAVATTLTVLVGGALIRVVDAAAFPSIGIGMWWALQTVTTVGYGDVVPGTAAGRFIGSLIMIESITFLAIVTAWVTSSFVRRAQTERPAPGPPPAARPAPGPRPAARAVPPAADDPTGPGEVTQLLRALDARLRRIEAALGAGPGP
jgi:voltage-gated potassium channel